MRCAYSCLFLAALLANAPVYAFSVDGFTSCMSEDDVRATLKQRGIEDISSLESGLMIASDRSKNPLYVFSFSKNKLSILAQHYPSSAKNFIILADELTKTHGTPHTFVPSRKLRQMGEVDELRIEWLDRYSKDTITLSYAAMPANDALQVSYRSPCK